MDIVSLSDNEKEKFQKIPELIWQRLNEKGKTLFELEKNNDILEDVKQEEFCEQPIWHHKTDMDIFVAEKLNLNPDKWGTDKSKNRFYKEVANGISELRNNGKIIDWKHDSRTGIWRLKSSKYLNALTSDQKILPQSVSHDKSLDYMLLEKNSSSYIYSNDEIQKLFHVGNMGGIRYTSKNNNIVILSTFSGDYSDEIDSEHDIVKYSGEGKDSDQEFTGGNRKILDSKGSNMYLFQEIPQEKGSLRRGALDKKFFFIGKVVYAGHYFEDMTYVNGKVQSIIKFLLKIQLRPTRGAPQESGKLTEIYVKNHFGTNDYSSPDLETTAIGRARQKQFREWLLVGYGRKCMFCGFNLERYLIGSHIVPHREMQKWDPKNVVNPSNGLLLCRLCDTSFEIGDIRVTTEYNIEKSDNLSQLASKSSSTHSWISQINKGLIIDESSRLKPDKQYLEKKLQLLNEQRTIS